MVSYVEKYQPDLVETLVPVVSPMLAHAAHIKARLGVRTHVVFIGPCVAKKAEAQKGRNARLVSCALTFTELFEWLAMAHIDLATCEESQFDEPPRGAARYFPLPGGLARTAAMHTDLLGAESVAPSGFEEVREALESCRSDQHLRMIEPLFCPQGCVNGPGFRPTINLYARRAQLLSYAGKESPAEQAANHSVNSAPPADAAAASVEGVSARSASAGIDATLDLAIRYGEVRPVGKQFTEEQIKAVFEKTGKTRPEDQLNCGACGFPSCREKAVAVLQGLAEPEMCLPWMRRMAERRTDRIIETSPNGIIILNDRLEILSMNPAFRRMFCCSEALCGRRISYLMDPEPFERLVADSENVLNITANHEKYKLLCREILYYLPEEEQYIGIFVNITDSEEGAERLRQLQSRTAEQARELLDHQVTMAQQIAKLLGESTARGEELVRNMLALVNDPRIREGGGT